MKTFYLTMIIAVFLVLSTNGIQAQSTQPKLNQVELMKQFIGNWKCDIAKDTIAFWDARSYGTGFECNYKYVTKGKSVIEGKGLYGYDKNIDKCINTSMSKGQDIAVYAFWFTSKDKYVEFLYSNMLNPEKATFKVEGEFKSSDMVVETTIINNNPVKTDSWTRVK